MAMIVLAACSGSPGTTALAHALAADWPRRSLLVEADPDGGRLGARCGLPARPGLVELAAVTRAGRVETSDLTRVCQRCTDGVDVVVAHPAAEQVGAILSSSAVRIADALRTLSDVDVLVDIGRLRPSSPALPLLGGASQLLIVSGTRLEDVASLVHRRTLISQIAPQLSVGLIVTAPGEHAAAEAARTVELPLVGVRPGRSGRRVGERSRRRDSVWTRQLAGVLAAEPPERPHAGVDPSFAVPSGPPLPGPSTPDPVLGARRRSIVDVPVEST